MFQAVFSFFSVHSKNSGKGLEETQRGQLSHLCGQDARFGRSHLILMLEGWRAVFKIKRLLLLEEKKKKECWANKNEVFPQHRSSCSEQAEEKSIQMKYYRIVYLIPT